jgi:hypothetical protein
MRLTGAEKSARFYARHRSEILARQSRKYASDPTLRAYRARHRRMCRMADRWLEEWRFRTWMESRRAA